VIFLRLPNCPFRALSYTAFEKKGKFFCFEPKKRPKKAQKRPDLCPLEKVQRAWGRAKKTNVPKHYLEGSAKNLLLSCKRTSDKM